MMLSQAFSWPLFTKNAEARTQVTITFAAGGVACGIYFFFQFTAGQFMMLENKNDAYALLNRGQEGWEIKFPAVNIMQSEETKMIRPQPSPAIMQMELLKFRF